MSKPALPSVQWGTWDKLAHFCKPYHFPVLFFKSGYQTRVKHLLHARHSSGPLGCYTLTKENHVHCGKAFSPLQLPSHCLV